MNSLKFRQAAESDMAFIYDSWLRSFKHAHAAGPIPMEIYWDVYKKALDIIMARPGVLIIVAYHPGLSPESKADIHGWSCIEKLDGETPVVHYIHVKKERRGSGIARMMLAEAGIDVESELYYTFKSRAGGQLAKAFPNVRFDPLIARFPRLKND